MFAEYLGRHPLIDDLLTAYTLYPSAEEDAWANIPAAYREEILRKAEEAERQPYPMRTASQFLRFTRDGSRKADEDPYFARRRKLCWSVLRCCIEKDASLDSVIDGIWCVCEETSWVISAHNVNPIPGAVGTPLPDREAPYIDLFAAQTGMILSLTHHLLGKKLDGVSPVITRRIEQEIRFRLLDPFMATDDFWWMGVRRKDLNNWTPWILSNLFFCACLQPMEKKDRAAFLDRGLRMLDRWLDVVPEDGGCDEGTGYWNMAGGALLDCLEILETVTAGKMVFWQNEKLRNILQFPRKMELGNGWFVNFADCDARPFLSGERLQYAGERLGDPTLTAMGNRLRGTLNDQLSDVPHLSRLLDVLFHPIGQEKEPAVPTDEWLENTQVRIVRKNSMTLCCKGGHNGESHNHNDVGSFMLYLGGEPMMVDAGNMVYTAKTFSDERYTLWNVRSVYHNLPLINGQEQRDGSNYRAENVQCLPDGLSLEMAPAYPKEANVESAVRVMRLTDAGFTLHDQITLHQEGPVAWVFMLRHPPKLEENRILSGEIALSCPAGLRFASEEIPISDPRMARNFPGILYRVTLTGDACLCHDAEFTVSRRKEH